VQIVTTQSPRAWDPASEELDEVRQAQGSIGASYPNTQAGIKARQALQATVASPALPPLASAFDVSNPKK